jgi:hypothetical protein
VIKWPELEADYSLKSSVELKRSWKFASFVPLWRCTYRSILVFHFFKMSLLFFTVSETEATSFHSQDSGGTPTSVILFHNGLGLYRVPLVRHCIYGIILQKAWTLIKGNLKSLVQQSEKHVKNFCCKSCKEETKSRWEYIRMDLG